MPYHLWFNTCVARKAQANQEEGEGTRMETRNALKARAAYGMLAERYGRYLDRIGVTGENADPKLVELFEQELSVLRERF